jgi:AcrR family transcriptional regulator
MCPLDRKERDRQLREADILRAAEHIFATKGHYKATISDIAKEAQYAVGTIYLYFKNKQRLYLILIEKKVQDLISTVKEKVNQVNEAREKIRVLVEQQLSYFEENEDFFRIYFSERGGLRWTIKDKISRSAVDEFLKYLDYIAELIKLAQREGAIKKELDAKRTAYLLASMMNATVFPWLREEPRQKERLKGLSKYVLEVFFEGVGKK